MKLSPAMKWALRQADEITPELFRIRRDTDYRTARALQSRWLCVFDSNTLTPAGIAERERLLK